MTPEARDRGRAALLLLSRRRRPVAAALVVLAVATALPVLAPADPAGVAVLTAARDLAPGAVLEARDLTSTTLPPDAVPEGLLPRAGLEGRVLAGAVRRGEALTDARVVGPGLLDGADDDVVASPLRLADPAAALLLRSGDLVDVLAASTHEGGPAYAEVVAASARVVAVPQADSDAEGALVVVAVPARTASRLAASAVTSRLSVVLRA